ELGDLLEVDVRGGDVVEQEEGRRAAAEHVVDAVRGEVHPAGAEASGAPLQDQLRADAVGRGGEEAALVERVQAGEAAEAGRAGRLDRGAEPLDDGVRGVQRDAGCAVRAGVLRQGTESTIRCRWTRRRSTSARSRGGSWRRRSSSGRCGRRSWPAPGPAATRIATRTSICSSTWTSRSRRDGWSGSARRSAASGSSG